MTNTINPININSFLSLNMLTEELIELVNNKNKTFFKKLHLEYINIKYYFQLYKQVKDTEQIMSEIIDEMLISKTFENLDILKVDGEIDEDLIKLKENVEYQKSFSIDEFITSISIINKNIETLETIISIYNKKIKNELYTGSLLQRLNEKSLNNQYVFIQLLENYVLGLPIDKYKNFKNKDFIESIKRDRQKAKNDAKEIMADIDFLQEDIING